MKTPQELGKR